jgi:flagellar assembly protein FliH
MKVWHEIIQLPRPLREVRSSAPLLVTYSEEQMRSREQQSFEQGRREAEQTWKADISRERSELSKLETSLLESVRGVLPKIARDSESALIGLALEVARKLVADLPISPEMVEMAMREALVEVEDNTDIAILLHPADLELLQNKDSSLFQTKSNGRVHFESSPEVSRGGCLVKTSFGTIDGRRETKFELLKRSLAA